MPTQSSNITNIGSEILNDCLLEHEFYSCVEIKSDIVFNSFLLCSPIPFGSDMESASEIAKIMQSKFKFYDVERSIYLENHNKVNAPEDFAKLICDGFRPGDVPENLRKLYREAVYGSDKAVKRRIIKRVYAIGNKLQ